MSITQRKNIFTKILQNNLITKESQNITTDQKQGEQYAQKAYNQLSEELAKEIANEFDLLIEQELNS